MHSVTARFRHNIELCSSRLPAPSHTRHRNTLAPNTIRSHTAKFDSSGNSKDPMQFNPRKLASRTTRVETVLTIASPPNSPTQTSASTP